MTLCGNMGVLEQELAAYVLAAVLILFAGKGGYLFGFKRASRQGAHKQISES
jgi:hypothetical protein